MAVVPDVLAAVAVGRVDLPGFALKEMPHAQVQTAGVYAGLNDVIAQVHELKIGARVQADGILADPQYGARVLDNDKSLKACVVVPIASGMLSIGQCRSKGGNGSPRATTSTSGRQRSRRTSGFPTRFGSWRRGPVRNSTTAAATDSGRRSSDRAALGATRSWKPAMAA